MSFGSLARISGNVSAASLLLFGLIAISAPAAQANAAWNSDRVGWQGTGSVFTPSGNFGGAGSSGSSCVGCRWEVIAVCQRITAPGTTCGVNSTMGCPIGMKRYMVFFAAAGRDFDHITDTCMSPGQRPVSDTEMASFIRDRVNQAAPRQRIGVQPANGALTQLPAVFRSGQPASISRTDSIAGFSVRFRATASWRWGWGDGTTTTTTRTGGRYPNMSVAHTYRRSGQLRVRLRTRWTASFTVDGRGPYNVAGGPVTQSGELGLLVRQSRAVLVQDS